MCAFALRCIVPLHIMLPMLPSPLFDLPFPFPSGLPHILSSFPSCTFLQFLLPILPVRLLVLCHACRWMVVVATWCCLLKMQLWLCWCVSCHFEAFLLGGWHLLGIRNWVCRSASALLSDHPAPHCIHITINHNPPVSSSGAGCWVPVILSVGEGGLPSGVSQHPISSFWL